MTEVSVVIPTRGRPHLVGRAVASALAQSAPDLEVIVVVDGPDAETASVLAAIADPRLRVPAVVVCLCEEVIGRNAGHRKFIASGIQIGDKYIQRGSNCQGEVFGEMQISNNSEFPEIAECF